MSIETVHNYYERLVFAEISEHYSDKLDDESLADMACIALNRIPPRYIRYDIDMSFYLTPSEHIEIEDRVKKACKKAYQKIIKLSDRAELLSMDSAIHNHGQDE